MSIHVSYNQPDNEIHSYDGKPSAVVTGAGPAIIEIHMTAGEWDAANRLYYRQEATGVDGFVQASENNNQQFLLPCTYLASGELQIALNNPEQGLTTNLMKISITKMSSSGDLSDDDPQFTIDGKKRLVLVPGSQGILAVQFDNESESVTFKFPRYQDGVDLSTKTPYVNYRLPSSGELGKSLCSVDGDMLTDEYIYFSWTIDINVTMFEGSIKFQVEFSDSQGYRWQSQIAELPILTSLYNTGLEPYSPSFLEEALQQMQQYSSDAEAFAVGTRNGVPVAQGDPAYHKSALYLSNWFFERSVKPEAKEALLFLLEHVAYTDEHGQQYLDNLRDELYDTAEVVGIAATFVQDGVVYDTDSLDSLKPMLTVLATYEDLSVREITAYTLSGTLTEGTSTITVSYGEKTTTFDVVVTDSPIVWEWTPDKGMSGITMVASTGETPNYQLLSDAMRLYGPNASQTKWTGIALTEPLGLNDVTVEVYYKNLNRNADAAIGIIASTHGACASSGYLGYATYYANRSDSANPVSTTLRGASSNQVQRATPVISSGVVKCHINRDTPILNASYPGEYTMSDTPNQAATIDVFRVACVETSQQTLYADITRIVIVEGDTT